MNRYLPVFRSLSLFGVLCAAMLFAVTSAFAADDAKPGEKGGAKKEDQLPLSKVVMFNSGVGFFEHSGEIKGDAQVELKFNVKDINDLLKSMVLQDFGDGKISTVNYGSKDPITRTLKSFAVDLTKNPTLADLLGQIRGEKVQLSAPNAIVGTIVGVEKRKIRLKDELLEADFITLLTEGGLRSIALDQVTSIQLTSERLNSELQQALATLAMGHDVDKKTVTLNFLGNGQRPVRVGYIQEAPVWKTSYRLVLDDEKPPFLQGWAIVENTTEQDWNNVGLTLVSGRPISFIMDLYQPLYVNRPVVVPELYASLRPPVYDQDLAANEMEFRRKAGESKMAMAPPAASAPMMDAARGRQNRLGDKEEAFGDAAGFANKPFDPSQGVRSVAQAGDVGELFQYVIATPVNLPRQQSAMLPIVNDSVKGEKVSIYNPNVHAKHPLNGLRLTNSTALNLMQGPVTVFDGGVYAGDARIEDLQPGSERLISYAMDLDTEVAPTSKGHPEQLVSVRLAKGTLYTSRKLTRSQSYVVKNSGSKAKKVLIEYPFDSSWTLISPKEPAEKTRNLYRFAVTAEPGKPATLEIQEEQMVNQQFAVTNLDDGTIAYYMNTKVAGPEVKAALAEVIKRKQAIAQVVFKRQQLEREIQVVEQEQNRIRQNMAQLDRNSDIYNRYVKKFGDQEDLVEKTRAAIKAVIEEEQKLRKSLDDYLLGLELG